MLRTGRIFRSSQAREEGPARNDRKDVDHHQVEDAAGGHEQGNDAGSRIQGGGGRAEDHDHDLGREPADEQGFGKRGVLEPAAEHGEVGCEREEKDPEKAEEDEVRIAGDREIGRHEETDGDHDRGDRVDQDELEPPRGALE
ncbi:hypothetical protein GCM10023209_34450 [Roseibacterium beibuensis]|uniref:Uncharacterized protein n=1 Tax=[Roseibacterium] beibuensis TaxID=1193142 RepID=A0ABP9LPV7_9RHOB